ncbi:MAG: glycosyltransferase family 39 protein [Verrucomicrobia bacterium]|nr:glycosyltransferase family 39 protein [Verrucomicrobiota bacterium]
MPILTLFTFFFLLGCRALNEPDEGRYAEIAREMLQTGNWLVPHLWYLPHLDKPPLAYWLIAISMKFFGQNEWAVRLPIALAGVSGVWAAFLLGGAVGGRRVAIWSALLLQSMLLYFVMARMLTTDIFLTQFVAWALYFFWRSWWAMQSQAADQKLNFFSWHLAGWLAIAAGFLVKGPIAVAAPLVPFLILLIFRRRQSAIPTFLAGAGAGFLLFFAVAAPWFLIVFQRVPGSARYMILGQAAGHLLGTTIKNRPGGAFYFFGILAIGLVPWTALPGWLWRRNHWRKLDPIAKDGWLFLNAAAIFTFVLFSLSRAKLPAYILPVFPPLAILMAWRFFGPNAIAMPKMAWRISLVLALLLPTIFPVLLRVAFLDSTPLWLRCQTPALAVAALLIFRLARQWQPTAIAAAAAGLALFGFLLTTAEIPPFQTTLRDNQTLKPIGLELANAIKPGDALVCWGKFPEGLPFYAGDAISPVHRPWLGDVDLTQVPFEFPGNRERDADRLLPDASALARMVESRQRVWIVAFGATLAKFHNAHPSLVLHPVMRCGQWQLFVNHDEPGPSREDSRLSSNFTLNSSVCPLKVFP